ncbi:MAG TPA: small basic protein [Candidatus Omnitrophota bacterium]|nr:small basic protein [Candidatus Omnitrophota bacterium]HPT07644.1 small basic protein [Candidatus Omnitrophota bacterium]
MSIHPSLNVSGNSSKSKTVLKRSERLRTMFEKNQWKEGERVYGLPKLKTIRLKLKKEKAEKAETPAAGAPAAAGAAGAGKAPAAGAKAPAAGAKAAAAKK